MITHINSISIFVTDQDRATDFYVTKLGFEKRRDDAMGPDSPRWIEVAPPGTQTTLVIYKPTKEMPGASSYETALSHIGQFAPFIFSVEDMEATRRELSSRGVEFQDPPMQMPWGWWATIKDPDGNSIGLHSA